MDDFLSIQNELIKCTVDFLIDKVSLDLSTRQPLSIWDRICLKLFGRYDFIKSLRLQMWWKRDRHGYKTKVELLFNDILSNNIEMQELKDDINSKEIFISFNNSDTLLVKSYISNSGQNGQKNFL